MGWEKRGNNLYYYRKKRDGDRVMSEYVGNGRMAQRISVEDREERERKWKEIEAMAQKRDSFRVVDQHAVQTSRLIKQVAEVFLIMAGYHKHKGQWRKARNGDR
jgi:hypothetical protein